MSPDVLVVGAGLVGACVATELAEAGHDVLVLEADFIGGGATAAAMGHLVVMDDTPFLLELTAASLRAWESLAPELPDACEDRVTGTLWLATTDDELQAAAGRLPALTEAGVAAELLDEDALAEVEPSLASGLVGALRVSADRVVYPPAAARFFVDRASAAGARLREGTPVRRLAADHVVLEDGSTIAAGAVVNAAGAKAAALSPLPSLVPRRGHLLVTDRVAVPVSHQLVELGYQASVRGGGGASVAFNVQPRPTGQLLVGSSREEVGWDPTPDRGLLARLLARARRFLPGLADTSILRSWVGFRPSTPDKLPLIGSLGEKEPWVIAGHEGLGITTAPVTARLLADLMLEREPALSPEHFRPDRFVAA
ncbi:MAG: FAD-dependent oxidoreductase [Acidobacteriota bacterium]